MSKGPLCFNRLRVLAGKSISSPLIETIEKEAAIQSPSFQYLILRIEYFKNIFTNKLVVSIEMDTNGIIAAVHMIGIVIVFHCTFSFGIVDVDILGGGNIVELEVFAVELIAAVL